MCCRQGRGCRQAFGIRFRGLMPGGLSGPRELANEEDGTAVNHAADHVSSGPCPPLRTGGGMGRIPHPPHRWRLMCLGAPWSLGTCCHRILSRSRSVCAAAGSPESGASCRCIARVHFAYPLHSDCRNRREQFVRIRLDAVSMDGTIVKLIPMGPAREKTFRSSPAGPLGDGPPGVVRLPRMSERRRRSRCSPDWPVMHLRGAGGSIAWEAAREIPPSLMDLAHEGNRTCQLLLELGFGPAIPPPRIPLHPLVCDQEDVRAAHEIERLFRRPEGISPHPAPMREF